MDPVAVVSCLKLVLVAGLALWLTIIVLNNVTDRGTNVRLIGRMMGMDEIKEDPLMGNGLQWRAIKSVVVHRLALCAVVVLQVVAVALLWRAAYLFLATTLGFGSVAAAVSAANLALVPFVALWFFFLCGGLWFGYWMKMGPVQQVHLTLLVVSMLATLVVNLIPPV